MLTVTENAATVIKVALQRRERPESAGTAHWSRNLSDSQLAVEIAPAPESGDAVIEDNGSALVPGRSRRPPAIDAGARRSDQRRQRSVPASDKA